MSETIPAKKSWRESKERRREVGEWQRDKQRKKRGWGERPNKRQREDERLVFPTPGWFVTLEVRHIGLGLPGALQECELLQQESASSTSTPLAKDSSRGATSREDRGGPPQRAGILPRLKSTSVLDAVPEKTAEGSVLEDETGVMFFLLLTMKTSKTNNAATSLALSPELVCSPESTAKSSPRTKHQKPTRTRRAGCLLQRDAQRMCYPCLTAVTIVTASHFTLMTDMCSVHILSVITYFNIIFTMLSL